MIHNIQAPLEFIDDPKTLEGEWNFKGYYPFDCKARPNCHTF